MGGQKKISSVILYFFNIWMECEKKFNGIFYSVGCRAEIRTRGCPAAHHLLSHAAPVWIPLAINEKICETNFFFSYLLWMLLGCFLHSYYDFFHHVDVDKLTLLHLLHRRCCWHKHIQIIVGVVDIGKKHKVVNISANLRKNSQGPQWDTQGPEGNWFMKKTWTRKSRARLPLSVLNP